MGTATWETRSGARAVLTEVRPRRALLLLLLIFLIGVGLPAFKPGEKVEIDLGMDDI